MKKILLFSLLCTAAFSCQNQSTSDARMTPSSSVEKNIALKESPAETEAAAMNNDSLSSPYAVSSTRSKSGETPPSVSDNQSLERKIIRTAEMKFKVAKTDNATYKVEGIVKKFGGYVTESRMNSTIIAEKEMPASGDSVMQITQYQLENTMVVRVPNNVLDTFLTEMSRIYVFLDHRRVSADDVTLAYISSQLKAKNRESAAQRIQNATDAKGKQLDDIVTAETAKSQLRDEAIDQQIANAEKDFNIQYSLVNLNIYQDMDIVTTMKANPALYAYGPGFFSRIKEAFAWGWAMVLDIIVGLLSLWYLWVLIGFALILYKKYGGMFKFRGNRA